MNTHPFDNDGMVEFDHWVPSVKPVVKICESCGKSIEHGKGKRITVGMKWIHISCWEEINVLR